MKNKFLLLLIIASFVGLGCSSNKSSTATPPETPPVVDNPVTDTGGPGGVGTGGNKPSYSGGDTVDFIPASEKIFGAYVGTHPINSYSSLKVKLTVDLKDNGSLRYYGAIRITYDDAGQSWQGLFESGEDKNVSLSKLKDNGAMESKYNYWFNKDNAVVFSGPCRNAGCPRRDRRTAPFPCARRRR